MIVDSVPPHIGCEVFDEELIHEYWDENDSENFAGRRDSHVLQKWGEVKTNCYEG